MKKLLWITPFFALCFLFSCSQESSSLVSRSFHNLTARYNAYFLAKEKMLEIERDIEKMHVDDYNVIIDVLPEIDSNRTKNLQDKFDYCVEKASLPIQKHKNSNWVDDSYILLAKVRMYRGKNYLAIQTFRYVVQKSNDENTKQLALAYLIRCYLEEEDYTSANEAIEILSKEKLSGETEKVYHLNRAHYYHQQRKYDSIPKSLLAAIPHLKNKDRRARMHFILGQTYQKYGKSELALKHYTRATKKNPPYETEFFARLNRSREVSMDNEKQVKKSEKFYNYSLKEEKNEEYKGRIYYEMALFELKKENIDSSIALLNLSTMQNDKYSSQKGYSYERLGDIYFKYEPLKPQKESYKLSKVYYDSTVNVVSKSIEGYDDIVERHEVLTDFVKQVNTIEKEDSLQRLSKLDSTELEKAIDKWVAEETKRKKEEILLAREAAKRKKQKETLDLFNGQSNFIFYNATALVQSKEKFIDVWGNRKLEDNWRRSRRDLIDIDNNGTTDTAKAQQKTNAEEEIEIFIDRSLFTKNIPSTPEEIVASKRKIIAAYYRLGKIYDFELKDLKRAHKTNATLLEEYPKNKYEAEVLYSNYLICSKNEFCDDKTYANQLFSEYSNSIFAKLVKNPNYVLDYEDENKLADKEYEKAYNLYLAGDYYQADIAVNRIYSLYGEADVSDKVSLLKALILAKRNELDAYEAALVSFQKDYRTSELIPYAKGLLEQLRKHEEDIKETPFVVIDTVYEFDLGEEHYFISMFNKSDVTYKQILEDFEKFNLQNYPNDKLTSNLFDYGNGLSMLRVGPFGFRQIADKYDTKLLNKNSFYKSKYQPKEKERFVITKSNMFILLKSKDLKGYKSFYDKRYQ